MTKENRGCWEDRFDEIFGDLCEYDSNDKVKQFIRNLLEETRKDEIEEMVGRLVERENDCAKCAIGKMEEVKQQEPNRVLDEVEKRMFPLSMSMCSSQGYLKGYNQCIHILKQILTQLRAEEKEGSDEM